jgi:hypothetical protein
VISRAFRRSPERIIRFGRLPFKAVSWQRLNASSDAFSAWCPQDVDSSALHVLIQFGERPLHMFRRFVLSVRVPARVQLIEDAGEGRALNLVHRVDQSAGF